VVNSNTVTLKTGGVGNTLLYAVGVAILMCAFAFGLLTRNDGRKSYKDRTARMGV
jgi:hypothetical protein